MLQGIGIQTVSGGTSSSLHSMPRVCSRSSTSSIEPAYHDHEQTTASFRAPLCAQAQTKSAPKRFARLLSGALRLTQAYQNSIPFVRALSVWESTHLRSSKMARPATLMPSTLSTCSRLKDRGKGFADLVDTSGTGSEPGFAGSRLSQSRLNRSMDVAGGSIAGCLSCLPAEDDPHNSVRNARADLRTKCFCPLGVAS
jgi:hypothetical protein